MSTQIVNIVDAVTHLPDDASLRLSGVAWEEYQTLLTDLTDWPGMRVTYDSGELEIMSPSPQHEEYKEFVYSLARVISEESNIVLETRGATSFMQERLLKGAEPDTCFYIQHASNMIGKRKIDLDVDPPPDVVVEIEITRQALNKFKIYAAFRVPEIWRYDAKETRFYMLEGGAYTTIDESLAFPGLTAAALSNFLEQSKSTGQTAALNAFRIWWRGRISAAENHSS